MADLQNRMTVLESTIASVQSPDRESEPVAETDETDGPEAEFTEEIEGDLEDESSDVFE